MTRYYHAFSFVNINSINVLRVLVAEPVVVVVQVAAVAQVVAAADVVHLPVAANFRDVRRLCDKYNRLSYE